MAKSIGPTYPIEFVSKVIEGSYRQGKMLILASNLTNVANLSTRPNASQGGAVLVHCTMGRSRSVSIVVAYLMKKHGRSLSHALEHAKSKRPQASPNSGFLSQLQEYEKSLRRAVDRCN